MATFSDAIAAIEQAGGGAPPPADANAPSPLQRGLAAVENPESPEALGLAQGQVTGDANNAAAGVAQGAAGLVNTATDPVGNLIGRPVATAIVAAHDVLAPLFGYERFPPNVRNALLGDTVDQPGTKILNAASDVAGLPRAEDVVPTTETQKTNRAGVSGAASMAPFGPLASVAGYVGGVLGKVAGEHVPEYLQPLTEMVGNYLGQMGFYHAGTAGTAAHQFARDVIDNSRGPIGAGGSAPVVDPATGMPLTRALAGPPGSLPPEPLIATPRDVAATGTVLAQRAGLTPQQLAETLRTAPIPPVDNLEPTVPTQVTEATGNPALLAYQKQIMNASPEIQAAFDARHSQNVLSIVNALQTAAPTDVGHAAGTYLRNQLSALHALTDLSNRNAQSAASNAIAAAGLNPPVTPTTVQAMGSAQRSALVAQQERDYRAEQAAYDAMPGNLAVDMNPVGDAARDMLVREPGPGGSFHPAEAKIYNDAADFNGVIPFEQVRQLLRNTSAAKRQITKDLGPETPAYGRLSTFQGALTDALGDAADRGSSADAAAGTPPGQRISDKIGAMASVQPATQFIRLPSGAVLDTSKMTGMAAPGTSGGAIGTAPAIPENFTPENRQLWRDRNQAYAVYKDKWRYGTMGDVTRAGARYLGFKVPDSKVSDWLFPAGPKGAEAADDLAKALGSHAAALRVIGDYPALTLRNAAMRDGTFDLGRYETWRRAYGPALSKYPELATRFENAAIAQRSVEEAADRGRAAVERFEDTAARHYLTKEGEPADPQVAINRIMSSENPATTARDIMRRVGQDLAATNGVRRNLVDWMVNKMTARSELGTTGHMDANGGVLNGILKDPKMVRAIEQILSPSQVGRVFQLREQLNQLARSWNAIKLRGSPGTAMDIIRAGAMNHGFKDFTHMAAMLMTYSMLEHYGPQGLIAAPIIEVAGNMLNSLRAAGIKTRMDLMAQAMLNPKFGRLAAEAASQNPRAPVNKLTQKRIIESLIGSAENTQEQANRRLHPIGGTLH